MLSGEPPPPIASMLKTGADPIEHGQDLATRQRWEKLELASGDFAEEFPVDRTNYLRHLYNEREFGDHHRTVFSGP